MISGIDLSHWNGPVDFAAVAAAGVQFALISTGDGGTFADPQFATNWQGAQAAGLVRGAYQFCRPEAGPPEADAAAFLARLDAVGGLEPGDLVAGDFETGSGDTGAWALAWLQAVEQALGFKPLCYTSPSYASEHNFAAYPALGDFGLWIAHYGVTAPAVPAPWTFQALWQHSDAGAVPGTTGAVDLDTANVTDAAQLRKYGLPVPAKPVWDNNDLVAMGRLLYRLDGTGNPDPDWAGARDYAGSKT